MSDFAPTETNLPSGVNAQQEDASVSEDQIKGADLDVSKDNIIDNDSGERAAKKDINYAEADQKADEAVESTAGISTQ